MEPTVRPIFLATVPDKKPRTECDCQPVAFISSLAVTPPGRLNRYRTLAVLLPGRGPSPCLAGFAFLAPLGAFFVGVAFFPDLPFFWNRDHVFSLRGDYRAHDIHPSPRLQRQVDSARYGVGTALTFSSSRALMVT